MHKTPERNSQLKQPKLYTDLAKYIFIPSQEQMHYIIWKKPHSLKDSIAAQKNQCFLGPGVKIRLIIWREGSLADSTCQKCCGLWHGFSVVLKTEKRREGGNTEGTLEISESLIVWWWAMLAENKSWSSWFTHDSYANLTVYKLFKMMKKNVLVMVCV